jgi:uncharacterized membrane protein YiaA
MEKFGNLGKLINLEGYYIPELVFTDFSAMGYSKARIERLELEELKEHSTFKETHQDGRRLA